MRMKKKIKNMIKSMICVMLLIIYVANSVVVSAVTCRTMGNNEVGNYSKNECIFANQINIQSNDKQILSETNTFNKEKNNIMDGIMYSLEEETTNHDILNVSNNVYNNKFSTYSSSTTNIHVGNCKLNNTIVSEENIAISASEIIGDNIILCSKNGNVNLNAADVQLGGIIYAPNGKVSINGDNVRFNGIIITNIVDIFAGSVSIANKDEELYEKLVNYKKTNLTEFAMYYSDEDNKIGVSYEEDYRTIDFYYRYDDQDFQCKKNYNLNNHLEVPKEFGYLEGYLKVIDCFGNVTISNIVTFYNDGSCYEKFKDSDGDGIGDAYEIRDLGTNPYLEDTDGDGIIDAYDIYDNEQYYDIMFELDVKTYRSIVSKVGDMFYVDEKNSTEEEKICYLKKSKLDAVNSIYNDENILITNVFNKITGKEIIRFYKDKYSLYIYDNREQKIATIVKAGDNNIVNMYNYDENGNPVSILHNDFTYDLVYDNENLSKVMIEGKNLWDYEYDEEGNLKKIIYGNGYEKNIEYDELGNILKIFDNEKTLYEWEYDEHYILSTYIDYVNNSRTDYFYDDEGMIQKIVDSKGGSFEYINEENYLKKTFKNGVKEYIMEFFKEESSSLCKYNNHLTKEMIMETGDEERQVFSYNGTSIAIDIQKKMGDYVIKTIGKDEYKYLFADNGNILEEYINGELKNSYEYDDLNQMIRANSGEQDLTVVYEYDAGGNVISQKYYDLSFDVKTQNLTKEIKRIDYQYDSEWKDKLIYFDSNNIKYDEIGNPILYRDDMIFEWEQGRNLYNISKKDEKIATYTYNSEGIRTSKILKDNTIQYYMDGEKLIYEKGKDYDLYYLYDENNEVIGFEYKDNIYVYKKNILKDVIGIIDMNGIEIASYKYDAWGNVIKINGDKKIAKMNPIRFKCYYYDEESGLYYLNSRYYDARTGRFINADKYIETNVGIHSNNMFAYCENSPLTRINATGEAWWIVAGFAAAAAVSLSACSNYKPKYNTLYAWDKKTMEKYNCYGYAINVFSAFINPGYFSNKTFKWDLDVLVDNAIADLKKRRYTQVKEIKKSEISSAKGTVIALRLGKDDYHWMRYNKTAKGWLHKPGQTAILKLKDNPYDYDVWYGEVYDNYWHKVSNKYTSDIKYIVYK